jgi:hypothetical protein
MGFFSRLFREKEKVFIDGEGDFDQEVVGAIIKNNKRHPLIENLVMILS